MITTHGRMHSAIRLLAMIVWLAAPALSQAQTAEVPPPTTFNAGDTWEWRHVEHGTEVEARKVTVTVVNIDGQLQVNNGATTRPLASWYRDDGFNPSPKPWRVWPLHVGKKWSVDADWARPDGITGNTQQDVEVVAYEEVTVPAGTFMAFKIVHRGWYRNSRHSHGELNDTFWYAPEAKADVKHVREVLRNVYTRELTAYRRGAP